MRINRSDRKAALTGATGGAVVGTFFLRFISLLFMSAFFCLACILTRRASACQGGASGAGIGAAIGLAMIPIAPVSVPIGFVVTSPTHSCSTDQSFSILFI
jgi:hypothetical protein